MGGACGCGVPGARRRRGGRARSARWAADPLLARPATKGSGSAAGGLSGRAAAARGRLSAFEGAVVVWPREAELDLSAPGRIVVRDEGASVAVGDPMSVTGGPWPGRLDSAAVGACADRSATVLNGFRALSEAEWGRITGQASLPEPQSRSPPGAAGPVPPAPANLPPQASDGRFLVEAVSGRQLPPGAPPGHVTLGRDTVVAASQCVSWRWSWSSAPTRPRTRRLPPGPQCVRPVTLWEQEIERVVDNLEGSAWRPDGAQLLLGSAGSLTLRARSLEPSRHRPLPVSWRTERELGAGLTPAGPGQTRPTS